MLYQYSVLLVYGSICAPYGILDYMQLKKYRWSRDYESSEEELMQFFISKKIEPVRWNGAEHEVYANHSHDYDKKLWCAEGSIKFVITSGKGVRDQIFSLQPGDALDIPAGTAHSALAGISGCVCYEDRRTLQS